MFSLYKNFLNLFKPRIEQDFLLNKQAQQGNPPDDDQEEETDSSEAPIPPPPNQRLRPITGPWQDTPFNPRWKRPIDPRSGIHFVPWEVIKPKSPTTQIPQRGIDPELIIPQVEKGDIVKIIYGFSVKANLVKIAVVSHADLSGIYGWFSVPKTKTGPRAAQQALDKALDLFVGYEVYGIQEYAPQLLVPTSQLKSVEVIGDAWEVANISGPPTNLPNENDTTSFAPVKSSNPTVNTALHRHKYLLFWYINLANTRRSYRRVEPLYVFIHPNTQNELLLTLDRGAQYFRSFAVPNMSDVKMGTVYAFDEDKMLKRVNKTLINIESDYKDKYEDIEKLEKALTDNNVYVGLLGYKEFLEHEKAKKELAKEYYEKEIEELKDLYFGEDEIEKESFILTKTSTKPVDIEPYFSILWGELKEFLIALDNKKRQDKVAGGYSPELYDWIANASADMNRNIQQRLDSEPLRIRNIEAPVLQLKIGKNPYKNLSNAQGFVNHDYIWLDLNDILSDIPIHHWKGVLRHELAHWVMIKYRGDKLPSVIQKATDDSLSAYYNHPAEIDANIQTILSELEALPAGVSPVSVLKEGRLPEYSVMAREMWGDLTQQNKNRIMKSLWTYFTEKEQSENPLNIKTSSFKPNYINEEL